MSGKYFDGCAPAKPASFDAFDNPLAKIADGLVERYMAKMDVLDYGGAKDEVMELIHAANHYIEDSEPWALAKDEAKADELAFVIYNLLEAIRIAAHLLMPLMPQTSAEALRRLSCEDEAASDDLKGICASGPACWWSTRREGRSAVPASRLAAARHIGNLLCNCKGMAATVHALLLTMQPPC